MKLLRMAVLTVLIIAGIASCVKPPETANLKPWTLPACPVCAMKCEQMGKGCTFGYAGREIKVCDKGEQAEFLKDPAKYLKAIEAAELKGQR